MSTLSLPIPFNISNAKKQNHITLKHIKVIKVSNVEIKIKWGVRLQRAELRNRKYQRKHTYALFMDTDKEYNRIDMDLLIYKVLRNNISATLFNNNTTNKSFIYWW